MNMCHEACRHGITTVITFVITLLLLLGFSHSSDFVLKGRLAIGSPAVFFSSKMLRYVFAMKEDLFINGSIILVDQNRIITSNGKAHYTIAGRFLANNQQNVSYQEGIGESAIFNLITDFVQLNTSTIIVADCFNNCLRKVDRLTNQTQPFVGTCGSAGTRSGTAADAQFHWPSGLFLHKDELFVTDYLNQRVQRLAIATMAVSTLAKIPSYPLNLLMISPNLLLLSHGCDDQNFTKQSSCGLTTISLPNGDVQALTAYSRGYADGKIEKAQFAGYSNMAWLDQGSTVLYTDFDNGKLRLVNLSSKAVSTICQDCMCDMRYPRSVLAVGKTLYVGSWAEVRRYELIDGGNETQCCKKKCEQKRECRNFNSTYDCYCKAEFSGNEMDCNVSPIFTESASISTEQSIKSHDLIIGLTVPLLALVVIAVSTALGVLRYRKIHHQRNAVDVIESASMSSKLHDYCGQPQANRNENAWSNLRISGEFIEILGSFKIPSENLQIGIVVGKGHFGKVHKAKMKVPESDHVLTVAVKSLIDEHLSKEDVESFLTEAIVMLDFNHPNVLALIGIVWDSDDEAPLLVLPFMEHGALKSLIAETELNLSVGDLLHFALQVAYGMEYLEKKKFVHRDLAARNCMVDAHNIVRISDFGLSIDVYETEYYRSGDNHLPLPIKWMALESISEGRFTTKSDVWSYGVVLWELMTRGGMPYLTVHPSDMKMYLTGGGRLDRPYTCPQPVYDLMKKCWLESAHERPSFSGIIAEIVEIFNCSSSSAVSDCLYDRNYTKRIPNNYFLNVKEFYASYVLGAHTPDDDEDSQDYVNVLKEPAPEVQGQFMNYVRQASELEETTSQE